MAGPLLLDADAKECFPLPGPQLRAADAEPSEYMGHGVRAVPDVPSGSNEREQALPSVLASYMLIASVREQALPNVIAPYMLIAASTTSFCHFWRRCRRSVRCAGGGGFGCGCGCGGGGGGS